MTTYQALRTELRAIERSNYENPLDYTRAAILRATLRTWSVADATWPAENVDAMEAREALRVHAGIRLP